MDSQTKRQTLDTLGGFADQIFLDIPRLIHPFIRKRREIGREAYEAELDYLLNEGYAERPRSFFQLPQKRPGFETINEQPYQQGRRQVITYTSEYQPVNPHVRERFQAYQANQTGYLVRWTHGHAGRKTVLCLHGYTLGNPKQAERMFRVARLFSLGLDAALFIAPFHWRRAPGTFAERGIYLQPEDPAMTAECVGQTMYDLAGCLHILKETGAGEVGLLGASMGGYNAALFSCLSSEPTFAAMMVPAVNYSKPLGPEHARLPFRLEGELLEKSLRLWEFHSPLYLKPRMPLNRLLFIASRGDRICPFEYTRDLVERWGGPEHHFHTGGHWLIFNRKARGRAWYAFLSRMGFLP